MTSALDALASVIGDRTAPSNLDLFSGTVISIGTTIRVDAAGRQLSCDALVGCYVGEIVWVAVVGATNLVIGEVLPGEGQWGSLGFTGGFSGTWGNYGSGYMGASIRRKEGGVVELAGLVTAGSSGTIFQIAAGWRPPSNRMWPAVCSVGGSQVHARFEVASTGVASAVFAGGGTAQFFAFDVEWPLF